MVEYEAPSASITITRARRASSARILRLRRRRSNSVRSSAVSISAIWRAAYQYYFSEYRPLASGGASFVLLCGDVFQPVHRLAIELFLNRNVRHRRGRRCAMPVFLTGRKPDDV